MRSVILLAAAGAASLFTTAATAADMRLAPPPPPPAYYGPPPAEDFGGWYLRGDIGMTNTSGKLHVNAYDTLPANSLGQYGHGFDSGMSYGLGIGYQFNNWFRADITGEYRSRVRFSGTDFINVPAWGFSGSDVYDGGYKSWVGLVNVYADLGTWWCVTPFIGAGVGFANVKTTGLQDSGVFNIGGGQTSASYFAEGASKTNLAWALHAGLAYKVTNNFTVELSYRYLNMGKAVHGFGQSFDGTNAGPSSFQYRDLTSQDVRVGMRWTCCEVPPPPPPPLVTKG